MYIVPIQGRIRETCGYGDFCDSTFFDGFFNCLWNPGVSLDCTSSYELGVNKP